MPPPVELADAARDAITVPIQPDRHRLRRESQTTQPAGNGVTAKPRTLKAESPAPAKPAPPPQPRAAHPGKGRRDQSAHHNRTHRRRRCTRRRDRSGRRHFRRWQTRAVRVIPDIVVTSDVIGAILCGSGAAVHRPQQPQRAGAATAVMRASHVSARSEFPAYKSGAFVAIRQWGQGEDWTSARRAATFTTAFRDVSANLHFSPTQRAVWRGCWRRLARRAPHQ